MDKKEKRALKLTIVSDVISLALLGIITFVSINDNLIGRNYLGTWISLAILPISITIYNTVGIIIDVYKDNKEIKRKLEEIEKKLELKDIEEKLEKIEKELSTKKEDEKSTVKAIIKTAKK